MMNELGGKSSKLFPIYQPPFETNGSISYPNNVPEPNNSLMKATPIRIIL